MTQDNTIPDLIPVNEDIEISISRDESEAVAQLIAPKLGGAPIGFEGAMQKIRQAGIVHGLNEQALKDLIEAKAYGRELTVAVATMPVDGENGTLVFHFQTASKTGRPKELESGKVDLKSLDLYEPVDEGQLLVSRTLATEGAPGTTVKGKVMKQRRGKDVAFPKGRNVEIDAAKTEMRAKCAGLVEYISGAVNVSSVYRVDGDVGPSVGNIDFDGSVQISGNVIAGHVIKASGGIFVGGVVEASELIAGGNVEVKRGMQGMDRGKIEAAGSISILYIERGKAIAGGTVTVDASIHSTIEAGVSLYAKGKRGSIIGGHASAAVEIVANCIGSVSNVQTDVEIGSMPQKRERLSFLEKETERLAGEMDKLDVQDAYLKKSKEKLNAETLEKLSRSLVENRRNNTALLEEYSAEMDELKCEMEDATNGKLHVFDTVYPGARIMISSDMLKVNDEIKYATFKFKDGKVAYIPCEGRK
ncbi:MAG: FapA family protein [Oscillospiraceae bacterium]|jgi:uncharacterized protein (DUF342 family)|nr:FapA family protein [Oscillospiraceae bacterium]